MSEDDLTKLLELLNGDAHIEQDEKSGKFIVVDADGDELGKGDTAHAAAIDACQSMIRWLKQDRDECRTAIRRFTSAVKVLTEL